MALNYYRQGRQVAERNEEDNKVILYHYFAVHYKKQYLKHVKLLHARCSQINI